MPSTRTRIPPALSLALHLAALGWHVFPLTARDKRPLANCPRCPDGTPAHIAACPCLAAGRHCHAVYAATVDPDRLTRWWTDEPRAVPGIAAGPSGLVLIDIDAHGNPLPADLATGLLPGIDLAAEPIDPSAWKDPARFRDGRDTLALLARVRGNTSPWPQGPEHRPVTAGTPSGGRHLWYRAPAPDLRQVIADPDHGRGLAWQIDIKAGWSYGIAPGAHAGNGHYPLLKGDPAHVGDLPPWFADEVIRVASPPTLPNVPTPPARPLESGDRSRTYVAAVLANGTAGIVRLTDGRQAALGTLAFHVGGLLAAAGLDESDVADQLADAGTASGLTYAVAARTVARSLANGRNRPMVIPPARGQ